jgi:DNA-binding MurR/RpiR family transcriptional regulator
MNSQLSERIRQKSSGFSKGQRLIARYIEEHSDKVAFMTASRLGATVGVSESTVVRFATEIGYSGYPALQQAMQEMIRNKLTSVQRWEMTSRNIETERLLDVVVEQDIDILRHTKETIDREEFYRAADELVKAEKVYILGAGSSLALATFMAHYLRLVFDTVHLIEATSEATILQQLIRAKKGDALIAISFPRYSKKAAKTVKYATDQGLSTVAITDSPMSPIAEHASHLLLARSDMVSFVDSLVGPLSIINALIVTVAIKKKADVGETLRKFEHIWDEYGVYEKVDENDQ